MINSFTISSSSVNHSLSWRPESVETFEINQQVFNPCMKGYMLVKLGPLNIWGRHEVFVHFEIQ